MQEFNAKYKMTYTTQCHDSRIHGEAPAECKFVTRPRIHSGSRNVQWLNRQWWFPVCRPTTLVAIGACIKRGKVVHGSVFSRALTMDVAIMEMGFPIQKEANRNTEIGP